ncbi:MAG: glycosyltransferase family 9 protein, partial [Geminicoccaceae bacterium]
MSTTSSNLRSSKKKSLPEKRNIQSKDDILVIKLGALGDIFLADGALRDLRNHHKQDRITLLTTPPYLQLMERCPWVDRVQVDPRAPRWRLDRMWQLRRQLRAGRLAKVYDLQDSGRTQFYFRYLFPSVPWSGKAVGCSDPFQDPKIPYVADRLAAQLEAAGVSPVHTKHPDLSWLADDGTPYLEEAGVQGQFVVLVSGS